MPEYSAQIIKDSVSPDGYRLTTMRLRYWRAIHDELMTHRVFTRNASSSRAVPVVKMIEEAQRDDLRAGPIEWHKDQKGMQGTIPLIGAEVDEAKRQWRLAACDAASRASFMVNRGLGHKQTINRLLMPFTHINVLVTSTDWQNFFGLRLDSGAAPEMRLLAQNMWKAYISSSPKLLQPGQWHLPFLDDEDLSPLMDALGGLRQERLPTGADFMELCKKVSTARNARVSYTSFETGQRSEPAADIGLHDRLVGSRPLHASPAEHCATPDSKEWDPEIGSMWEHRQEWGNFYGWRQYRKALPGENAAALPPEYEQELEEYIHKEEQRLGFRLRLR